ncbi:hypothetical protein [Sphaerisporangium album]|uniref:hypothetical protein n=1 Tax=Sphaerisporangium album TaxID=509200 RepID=UPI0015F05DA1|nr:hypothetical protein [Sphaerisporangium album]
MPDNPRDELRATVEARRDLGPEYENVLIESFLEKLDHTIETRVRAEVAAQHGHQEYAPPPGGAHPAPGRPSKQADPTIAIALGSLGIGVPLTAIAVTQAGPGGLFLAWTGIVLVNIAAALGRRRR